MTLKAGTPRGKVTPVKGERVIVISYDRDGNSTTGLDGWVTSITPDLITITATPDDNGRDNYDWTKYMRASFLIEDVSIARVA
jgi:hypothetical protein